MSKDTVTLSPEEYLLEVANAQGIACTSVSDGFVLLFTRKIVEGIIARMGESKQDKAVVFIKRHDLSPPEKMD